MSVVSAWDVEPVAAERLAGSANGVEFVGLGAVLAGLFRVADRTRSPTHQHGRVRR